MSASLDLSIWLSAGALLVAVVSGVVAVLSYRAADRAAHAAARSADADEVVAALEAERHAEQRLQALRDSLATAVRVVWNSPSVYLVNASAQRVDVACCCQGKGVPFVLGLPQPCSLEPGGTALMTMVEHPEGQPIEVVVIRSEGVDPSSSVRVTFRVGASEGVSNSWADRVN